MVLMGADGTLLRLVFVQQFEGLASRASVAPQPALSTRPRAAIRMILSRKRLSRQ